MLGVLWMVESFEPQARQLFTLNVKANDPAALRPKLEVAARRATGCSSNCDRRPQRTLTYEVHVPLDKKIDRLSNGILKLDPENATGVEWEEKKEKK